MTVEEYIRRKNEIVLELTNLELVPEDQIIDFEPVPLNLNKADGGICPYCVKYNPDDALEECMGCPMDIANNNCNIGEEYNEDDEYVLDTYHQVIEELHKRYHKKEVWGLISIPEIVDLAEEYNLSNGFPSLKN